MRARSDFFRYLSAFEAPLGKYAIAAPEDADQDALAAQMREAGVQPLKTILIAGGGAAGWMTAALCSRLFQGLYDIVLVESDQIGTIGVGEATIPAIKKFNELLGLEEDDFLRKTQGSFKLGIQFRDWWRKGESYLHGFGVIGQDLGWLRAHQYWLRMRELGRAPPFDNLAINNAMALSDKFMRARADMSESPIGHIAHA